LQEKFLCHRVIEQSLMSVVDKDGEAVVRCKQPDHNFCGGAPCCSYGSVFADHLNL
jgi:hypothetical protein